jgi:hypothetical protein
MPRMRLLKEALADIKASDPETALTLHGLRQLVITGEIPHCRIGNKILINLDVLECYFTNPEMKTEVLI